MGGRRRPRAGRRPSGVRSQGGGARPMSPRGVRLGTVIGAYRIVDFIDQGGMGIVYLAEHQMLQRTVAFKVLSDDLADDESFRARFLRESRLAVRLSKHPNVVQ